MTSRDITDADPQIKPGLVVVALADLRDYGYVISKPGAATLSQTLLYQITPQGLERIRNELPGALTHGQGNPVDA